MSDMRRRDFIALLGGAAVAWPLAARAQQGDRVRRIGVLMDLAADDPEGRARLAAFQAGLSRLGWADGGNTRIDIRWGAGVANLMRLYAEELVALAGCHFGIWQSVSRSTATIDDETAGRVHVGGRSGWRRLCRELGAAPRQHHRLHAAGIQHRH